MSVPLWGLRRRLAWLYAGLAAANIGAWAWALLQFRDRPLLFGSAILAYGLGLRHAMDADHIAAIDNVTRKLMQEGRRPLGVGMFFAVGHSTVVVLAAVAVVAGAEALAGSLDGIRTVGGVLGTSVSALFLFVIAAVNMAVLAGVWRTWRHVRAGGAYNEEDFDILLNSRGLLSRLFRPLFSMIGRSWHMLGLGFLFGLGFDTASEIALLGIAATQATAGLPVWSIMVFPALFAAGMILVDTTDGVLMLGAYGWAFLNPRRKLQYNLVISAISVVVAVAGGGVETLGLIGDRLTPGGGFWNAVAVVNDQLELLGFVTAGLLVLVWMAALLAGRLRGARLTRTAEGAPTTDA